MLLQKRSASANGISGLKNLAPKLVQAAQKIYDEWDAGDVDDESNLDGDFNVGFGGICQDIANELAEVLADAGFELTIVSQEIGEQHVYCVVKTDDGIYSVDISPYTYETGGGYQWKKIPGVTFGPEDIEFYCIDRDPNNFQMYSDS